MPVLSANICLSSLVGCDRFAKRPSRSSSCSLVILLRVFGGLPHESGHVPSVTTLTKENSVSNGAGDADVLAIIWNGYERGAVGISSVSWVWEGEAKTEGGRDK